MMYYIKGMADDIEKNIKRTNDMVERVKREIGIVGDQIVFSEYLHKIDDNTIEFILSPIFQILDNLGSTRERELLYDKIKNESSQVINLYSDILDYSAKYPKRRCTEYDMSVAAYVLIRTNWDINGKKVIDILRRTNAGRYLDSFTI